MFPWVYFPPPFLTANIPWMKFIVLTLIIVHGLKFLFNLCDTLWTLVSNIKKLVSGLINSRRIKPHTFRLFSFKSVSNLTKTHWSKIRKELQIMDLVHLTTSIVLFNYIYVFFILILG